MNMDLRLEFQGVVELDDQQVKTIIQSYFKDRFEDDMVQRIQFQEKDKKIRSLSCTVKLKGASAFPFFPADPSPLAETGFREKKQEEPGSEDGAFELSNEFLGVLLRGEVSFDQKIIDLPGLVKDTVHREDIRKIDRRILKLRYGFEKKGKQHSWEEVAKQVSHSELSVKNYHGKVMREIRVVIRSTVNQTLLKKAGGDLSKIQISEIMWQPKSARIFKEKFDLWNIKTLGQLHGMGESAMNKQLAFSEDKGLDAALKQEIFQLFTVFQQPLAE